MNLYHTWIYQNVLNTEWFVWGIVIFIFAFNILSPILLWRVVTSKKMSIMKRSKKEPANNTN